MSTGNPVADLLASPLSPDWTVEELAEQLLSAIAAQPADETQEFVLNADAITNRQMQLILRPLLACLATKAAAESGTPANLYSGRLSFKRLGPQGPVWILGEFENGPGGVRVTLRRQQDIVQSKETGITRSISLSGDDEMSNGRRT